jgi:hypothetical protein
MRYRPRYFSINDLYGWYQRDELTINPDFQRRPVWSPQARSYLIDTILKGFPIPAVHIRQIVDVREQKTVREVVDGQQRLRSVFDFLEGHLRILPSQSKEFGGREWEDLLEETQDEFLDYEVPVATLTGASDEDVLNVFARLNSYTIVLNAQEKLNAKFFGKFKQTAYELGTEHLVFWRTHGILTQRAILRMGDAQIATELLVAMIHGLTDKRSAIEPTYEQYDDEFPGQKDYVARFRAVIDTLERLFGEVLRETEFRRRPLFYSLFCVFYDAMYGLPGTGHLGIGRIAMAKKRELMVALQELSDQLLTEEAPRKYQRFRNASARQTDNIRPRQTRHDFLWRELPLV